MKNRISNSVFLVLTGVASAALADLKATSDDCTFIREKIVALPPQGGEVLVPAGTYTCASPIVLDRSNVRLKGDGEVLLRLGKNVNAPVVIMGDVVTPPKPLENVQVVNLKIDGNRWFQKFECWGGPCDGGGTSYIRNNGITVRAITNGLIQGVNITAARSGGIVTEKGCYDLVVDDVVATNNEFDGFAGYETVGARLTNLKLSRNRAAGISLDIRFHGNIFKDVLIDDNGDVGIFIRDANANIFEDVTIVNSGSHGVFLGQTDDPSTCPLGNEFQNLSVAGARGIGFRLNDVCGGNVLTGKTSFLENRDGCYAAVSGARIEIQGEVVCKE